MHQRDASTEVLTRAVLRYAVERMRLDPPPLDGPRPEEELAGLAGETITPEGIGGAEALRVFAEVLAPACVSTDHPRFLSFVPCAPTEAAILFDLVVGASALFAGTWLEGAGAVFAENQALRWLAGAAGYPSGAGGTFMPGGSSANLSALVTARHRWRSTADHRGQRGIVVTSSAVHASVVVAVARVMDADLVAAPVDERGALTGEALATTLDGLPEGDRDRVFAVVATAGTTNAGIVDDLAGAADVCARHGIWFHVDAAYGGAGLLAPSVRDRFRGIERSDSFVVDPHKWLFAPYDCAALLYRAPELARAAHSQRAEYLEVLDERVAWNPADYAFQLTRRARGLPFWFSVAAHGTDAYTAAVEATLTLTRDVAALIEATPHVELVLEPELSVVLFRRIGWRDRDYHDWSAWALDIGLTLTVPTRWRDETVLRFCFVNPRTTLDDVRTILDSLA